MINATAQTAGADLAEALEQAFGPGPYTADGQPLAALSGPVLALPDGVLLAPPRPSRRTPAVDPPALVLVTHSGPDAGRVIELRRGRYRLGRPGLALPAGSIPIELRDPALSRLHAELTVDARGVRITDLASQNGVWVDGSRIGTAELTTESRVFAGNTTFRICVPASARLPEAGPGSSGPLTVPVPPPGAYNPGMLAAAVIALGLGVVLAVTTGMWIFLAFSGITALTAFAGFAGFTRRRRRFHAAVSRTAAQDAARRRLAHPTPGDLAVAVLQSGLRHRKAEPTPASQPPRSFTEGNADMQAVPGLRLGTGSLPANIVLQASREAWAPPRLDDVPVTLSPASGAGIRIVGPAAETLGMLCSVLLQLASSRPGGAGPVIVLSRGDDRFVRDARLLPGVQLLSVADSAAAAAAIQGIAGQNSDAPLIVLAPPSAAADTCLLRAGLPESIRRAVVFLVGVEADATGASHADGGGGTASILLSEDGGVLRVDGTEQAFRPDLVGPLAFHRTAALLASARNRTAGRSAPNGLFPLSSGDIAASWARGGSPKAALGRHGAAPVSLDLLADGPHFLIAGTTGSGKSELLRTLVASLAAAVPPTRLNFLLIDFKGGSGLAPLARLPHAAGFLTDLSGENVARTLASLRSELKRRESLLAAAEASDLDGFNRSAPDSKTVPRLVVVIDEFRMLADAVPTAVTELMRIAVLGRSLGLHLVLATQRPQGAVTADIRANISTSVCLRVQSATESRDVVGCDDAADIPASSPGMAILRKAGAPPFPLKVSSTASSPGSPPPLLQTLAQYLSTPLDRRGSTPGRSLEELVEAVISAAADTGRPTEAQPPVQPPLPNVLPYRSGLPGSAGPGRSIILGLADRPEQQFQGVLGWNPRRDSHLALVGPPGSGTETTAALLAAEHLAALPGRHLYVLDGDGSLAWTAGHAQTGAYAAPYETRRAARVVSVLGGIVLQRLAHGQKGRGCSSSAGITLLVSGWGRWQDAFRSSRFTGAEDEVLGLVRDGEAAGVCLVINGNRELPAARFFQLIPNRLWFPAGLPDDALVAWPRMPPMEPVPGRAFIQGRIGAPAGAVAQCGEPPADFVRTPLPEGTTAPQRVEELPAYAAAEDLATASGPDRFPLGLHGDELDTAEAYLPSGTAFLVLGPPGSGRTTLLRQFERAAGRNMEVHRFDSGWFEPAPKTAESGNSGPEDGSPGGSAPGVGGPGAGNVRNCLILVDDADRLPLEAHALLIQFLDRGARLVLAAAPGFGLASRLPAAARLRSDPRGAVLAPEQQSDGEFFGVRLNLDASPRPGRGYLIAGTKATETQFACPA
ncbi:FHA domain-containing protein [Arthrobacter sp. Sa2BUA2]|uniref:FHA domain-containing protein n=1 Tax=Arthrobacter pullicola TaxID=2762224 RepID=A0ABR8YJ21_9MICC|nr:FtsK/SpoIIIE domain-containing protein [Arthrobacter pullicola]MBD8044205.1 FHA domain-containing protein [Arthrobacter pullicola]